MIFRFLDRIKESIRVWSLKHTEGKHPEIWLSAISFSEASFFLIPPDIFLISILLSNKAKRWFYYSGLTTIFSVLGGIFGYAIGFFFFDTFGKSIISFYGLESQFFQIKIAFESTAFWTVFVAGFTPIPYKIFTIAGGLFGINFPVFVFASFASRGLRFVSIGLLLKFFGKKIASVLYEYFNIFSMVLLITVVSVMYTLF